MQWAAEVSDPSVYRSQILTRSYKLLRLKCVAYSTLNDTDEDAQAERRLAERMGNGDIGCSPALVAPAALYLTAMINCLNPERSRSVIILRAGQCKWRF